MIDLERAKIQDGLYLCWQCGGEIPEDDFDKVDGRCYNCIEAEMDDEPLDDDYYDEDLD